MIRAGVGIASAEAVQTAAERAAEEALAGAGRADAALVFAAFEGPEDVDAALARIAEVLGTERIVGAGAHGVLGRGREIEQAPSIAVLALDGVESHAFILGDLRGHEADAGSEIAAQLGGPVRKEDLVVLLPDPRAFDPERLLHGVRTELAPAAVVGAGSADPVGDHPLQWYGRTAESGSLAGMVLRGSRPPRIGVTQATRPVTGLMTVTRAQGHWILELDGRPALDVYREVARGPLAEDLRRAASFLLVALPRDDDAPLRPGGYVVRNVAGFATEHDAIALPEMAKSGQRVALALRDPESAREDLKEMLASLADPAPAAGIYFDCCARGAGFFGVPGLEAAYIESVFGDVPVAGMFGSCEIGPIGGAAELLTYTGVLALLDG